MLVDTCCETRDVMSTFKMLQTHTSLRIAQKKHSCFIRIIFLRAVVAVEGAAI